LLLNARQNLSLHIGFSAKAVKPYSDLRNRGESVPCPRRTCASIIFRTSIVIFSLSLASQTWAQGEASDIRELLKNEILSLAVAEFQVRQYIIQNTAPLPKIPATREQWNSSAARLRHHLLDDVVFHGWPKEWIESAPKFEDAGVIETNQGYRIH